MHPANIELLKSLFTLNQQELHDFLYDFLEENYGQNSITECDKTYLFAKGDIDVLVVAHLDTVHKYTPKLDEIYHDQEKRVMLSPVGIGADDRCGVFMIMNLIFQGYKPHVAFVWDEEIGGIGSSAMVKDFMPSKFGVDINFAIQYDRRGHAQSVYYSLYNPEFEKYINAFGFDTNFGSYTDICEICPVWGFAGVNLSTGYMHEHTNGELVLLDTIEDTLAKSIQILEDQKENPKYFEYAELPRVTRPYSRDQGFWYDDDAYGYYDGYKYQYPDVDDEEDDNDIEYSDAEAQDVCIICGMSTPWYNMVDEPNQATNICKHCHATIYQEELKPAESFYKRILREMR